MHYCVKGIYNITSSVQAMEICNTWKLEAKWGHLSNKKVSAPILMPIYTCTYIMSIFEKKWKEGVNKYLIWHNKYV